MEVLARSESLTAAVVWLSMASVCYAGDKFPEFPAHQASDCAISKEQAGIRIGVQPVEDPKEQKQYFHTQLRGFIPVFVIVQNASDTESLLFVRTDLRYGAAAIPADSTPKPYGSAASVATVNSIVFGSASLVGGVGSDMALSKETQIQRNIQNKEMESKTLSPGASTHGFVYIPVTKNGPREKIRLLVPVTRAGTGDSVVLEVVF